MWSRDDQRVVIVDLELNQLENDPWAFHWSPLLDLQWKAHSGGHFPARSSAIQQPRLVNKYDYTIMTLLAKNWEIFSFYKFTSSNKLVNNFEFQLFYKIL